MKRIESRALLWALQILMLGSYVVLPHVVIIVWRLLTLRSIFGAFGGMALISAAVCLMAVLWVLFAAFPPSKYRTAVPRIRILVEARAIIIAGALALILQAAAMAYFYLGPHGFVDVPEAILFSDTIVTLAMTLLIFLNGAIRILAASRRLDLKTRLLIILTLWIPGVNVFDLAYLCQKALEEYKSAETLEDSEAAETGILEI
ncbi:MAG: hypothetical protein Q4C55_00355 [Eubacterium sp.]|nr:hypothetical protein [Eubacterium sp.]